MVLSVEALGRFMRKYGRLQRGAVYYTTSLMSPRKSTAPGKMILSGEYAVIFGYPGIAIPASCGVEVMWENTDETPMKIVLSAGTSAEIPPRLDSGQAPSPLTGDESYARKIVDQCIQASVGPEPDKGRPAKRGPSTGTLTIRNQIPVGRGMGSSTALVIAICKCLLRNECKEQALAIENIVNPGNSGLDFAVIWANHPVTFRKGTAPEPVSLNLDFLKHCTLIDTGKPNETTAELVAWMTLRGVYPESSRRAQDDTDVIAALKTIGHCTERLLAGENIMTVMHDHHRAQMALGVVTPEAQTIIADIEKKGGAAKVLGAGARSGGGGMVLALDKQQTKQEGSRAAGG